MTSPKSLRLGLILASSMAVVVAASCGRRPSRGSAADFDKAVDALTARGFPQGLESYFCSLGTNPDLGFRWAGTTAERAVGERVEAEMKAMGLANVRQEAVPVDVFDFKKASLTVGGLAIAASTIAGAPPTPAGGITAPVVYVKGGTAADFDAAGDVAGKLVLIDLRLSSWWFTMPAFEAGLRKAAGVVATFTPEDPRYYSVADDALGSFDGQYDMGAPPWIYIARRDGDRLKKELQAGPVQATMVLEEKITMAPEGGLSYNVVGELPGTGDDGQMVMLAAHQDVHFRAGADDTGALVNLLTIAKAMRESGYRPKHTVVFLATSGEEFGYTNANYEWCIGAWWAVTHAHPEWTGRVRALLNLETMAIKNSPLGMRGNPELGPWLDAFKSTAGAFATHGFEIEKTVSSWNDQWTFTAAGIPAIRFGASDEKYETLYHSNYETEALVDFPYLGAIAKVLFRAAGRLDEGVLPYSLKARADDLAAAVKAEELRAAGADEAAASRLTAAVASFAKAAEGFDARAGSVDKAGIDKANAVLIDVEKDLNSGLTGLSPAEDDATVYPHQAVLRDALSLGRALAALKAGRPDKAAALEAVKETYLTRLGVTFSHDAYRKQLTRFDPDFERITWAGQGQIPVPIDLVPEYRQIESGEYAGAIKSLEAWRLIRLGELNERLGRMAGLLEGVTQKLDAFAKGGSK